MQWVNLYLELELWYFVSTNKRYFIQREDYMEVVEIVDLYRLVLYYPVKALVNVDNINWRF